MFSYCSHWICLYIKNLWILKCSRSNFFDTFRYIIYRIILIRWCNRTFYKRSHVLIKQYSLIEHKIRIIIIKKYFFQWACCNRLFSYICYICSNIQFHYRTPKSFIAYTHHRIGYMNFVKSTGWTFKCISSNPCHLISFSLTFYIWRNF